MKRTAPTVAQLRAIVTAAGGTLEEDEGDRDSRTFQAVAPHGMLWQGDDLHCLCIRWEVVNPRLPAVYRDQARAANADTLRDVAERTRHGLRPMTPEESDLYAED